MKSIIFLVIIIFVIIIALFGYNKWSNKASVSPKIYNPINVDALEPSIEDTEESEGTKSKSSMVSNKTQKIKKMINELMDTQTL